MLSILLLLATAPQAPLPQVTGAATQPRSTVQTLPPASWPPAEGHAGQIPTLSDGSVLCENRVTQASDVVGSGDLMWRDRDQAVGLYRLLDRRVDGCPVPILVNEHVPGSNALGREIGRTPSPMIAPRR